MSGTLDYKSACNLKYLTTKLKTLNLLQTTAQGEGNTRKFDGKASAGVTRSKTNRASWWVLVHQCRCECEREREREREGERARGRVLVPVSC